MKKAFILSLLTVALVTSCNKNKGAKPVPPSTVGIVNVNNITGTWIPVGVSGLNGESEAMPTISWHYVFNVDSTYVRYFSPQTQNTGTFRIGKQQSIVDGKIYPSISFAGSSDKSIMILKGDSLTISDNYVGGSKHFFIRIN